MVFVACLSLSFGFIRWASTLFGTRYASGFSEARFDLVVAGMTTSQVESILGMPLEKVPLYPDAEHGENWIYSESPLGLNYEQRWVIFQNGKVATTIKHYWIE
jgi:hypothetical protein